MPFATAEDIQDASEQPDGCVIVRWRSLQPQDSVEFPGGIASTQDAFRRVVASLEPGHLVTVYLNGRRHATLQGPATGASVEDVCRAVAQLRSTKLCLRSGGGVCRIERFFSGMVRGEEVFEHVMDNLLALEDPHVIDENTVIAPPPSQTGSWAASSRVGCGCA